jgi:hypothetical protein
VRQTSLTCQNAGAGLCCNAKRTILPKGPDLINLSSLKRYNDASFAV